LSTTYVEVVFEGRAVETGSIEARLLAESLVGYSELFTRANSLVNGEASQAAVRVQTGFKGGSFVASLEFVQNVAEQAAQLITAHKFYDAAALIGIIGFIKREAVKESLIELYKWLKGKKPDQVNQVGNKELELVFGVQRKNVTSVTYNLYGDAAIREALGKVTTPLREADIERIAVRSDGAEQASIEKSEAEYFQPEPLRPEPDVGRARCHVGSFEAFVHRRKYLDFL